MISLNIEQILETLSAWKAERSSQAQDGNSLLKSIGNTIRFPKQENSELLTAEEFEKACQSGDTKVIRELIKQKAPLGDKMPTEEELAEIERKKGPCYCKSVFVEPQSDGTTVIKYAHDNVFQTVTYDKNGKMLKGQIKTIDKVAGFTSAQVDYGVNEDGKKYWIF